MYFNIYVCQYKQTDYIITSQQKILNWEMIQSKLNLKIDLKNKKKKKWHH